MSSSTRIDGKQTQAAGRSPQDLHWDIHAIVGELRDLTGVAGGANRVG